MTFRELLLELEAKTRRLEDGELDMQVIVRCCADDGNSMMGAITMISIDAGCTDDEALIIDAEEYVS